MTTEKAAFEEAQAAVDKAEDADAAWQAASEECDELDEIIQAEFAKLNQMTVRGKKLRVAQANLKAHLEAHSATLARVDRAWKAYLTAAQELNDAMKNVLPYCSPEEATNIRRDIEKHESLLAKRH